MPFTTCCFAPFDVLQNAFESSDPDAKTVSIYENGNTSGRSQTFKVASRNDRGSLIVFSGNVDGLGQTVHITFHSTNYQHKSTTVGL